MTSITDRKAELEAEAAEDEAAAELWNYYRKLYDNIERKIQLGKTPDEVISWLDTFYNWPEYADIRMICIKAIKSIYRYELTKAKAALSKVGTK